MVDRSTGLTTLTGLAMLILRTEELAMHVLSWIFYSLAAIVVGFGIVIVLTVRNGVARLLPYLIFLTAVPAAIGYGLDWWARQREQPR